ncbi:DUF2505 domain-containing protein [Gordonia desulfuricans]|uniref:DUF2505 domain-containing protein n=1 Tax=Gordonia desulfuricans TaxID=89051 RepID=A0A7K3LLX9_9ACTN|nr:MULTISPECIES: DUF2505 domain-containing protein [Gordonia]EMP12376.1 hypothetical protein ISGA_4280 [Gordonia sp. NB41Y]NDK89262.1 DUF2505 domain-containing protein [Gordonia desulfuricans]WLP89338.1 DUF2505 domain-containing protein [Gordonia sp. NB41Y]
MASSLKHSVSFPFSTARYWDIVSTEQYWHDLLEATNSSHGSLESFHRDGDTVVIELKQGVPEDRLPSAVTAVRPGDLEIPRTVRFTRSGDTITGTMTATVTGAPAKVDGEISVSGDPATVGYTGSATVSIPFLGGKIEKAIIGELEALLDNEREKTVTWDVEHP